jgi:hypothetical protein
MFKSSSSAVARVREAIATTASRHAVLEVAREFAVAPPLLSPSSPPSGAARPSFDRERKDEIAIPMMDALADDIQASAADAEAEAVTVAALPGLEQLWAETGAKDVAATIVVEKTIVDSHESAPPPPPSSLPGEYKYLARLNGMGSAASRYYMWYFTKESASASAEELAVELRRLFSGDSNANDAHAFECYDALHSLVPAQLDALRMSGRGVTPSQIMGAAFDARPNVLEWVRAHAGPDVWWSSVAIMRNLACASWHHHHAMSDEERRAKLVDDRRAKLDEERRAKLDDVERCCDLVMDDAWPWANAADRITFPFALFVGYADERRSDALIDWALRRAQHRYPIEGAKQDFESLRNVARRLTDRGQPSLADRLLEFIAQRTRLAKPLHRAKL